MAFERGAERSRPVVDLAHEPGRGLPQVVLEASGARADAARGASRVRRGPPVVRDPELGRALFRLPVDAAIGRDLFTVVAAVLVHLFAVDGVTEVDSDV